MNSDLLAELRARRQSVLGRWMSLLRRTHSVQFIERQGRIDMERLYDQVLCELENAQTHRLAPSSRQYESVCDMGALYATGAQALREQCLAAAEHVDIRDLALAAEKVSHAFARAVVATRSELAASWHAEMAEVNFDARRAELLGA